MAVEDSQDLIWAARGWEAMLFFVCFLYSSKAAVKIVVTQKDVAVEDETWDIVLVDGD